MRVTRATNQLRPLAANRGCHLRVVSGPDAGEEIDLPAAGVVVGADPSADIVLSDPAVSGRHCTITPTASGFAVQDLESRNGTMVDGVAITQASLPVGAMIRLGHTMLQLMPAEESVEIPPSDNHSFGALIGSSLPMRRVFALLERASQSAASVFFLGESGTGKELAARAVHDNSPRRNAPFVVFDCGAATETLIESDLFGHVRGAFTGANSDRQGAFAAAHGGTLFLDEIGDLPLALQPKLLRMLEAGEVIPLGSRKPERFDVRVVAATHRDVFAEVGRGGFRGDLYYRMAVVEAYLPALRQRAEDIPALVKLFLERAGAKEAAATVGGAALDRLTSYHWPGNVRELRNVISRAVALSRPGDTFEALPLMLRPTAPAQDGPPAIVADKPYHDAKAAITEAFERAYFTDLLRRAEGNISEAARLAGLERKYLYRLLERAGLRDGK